MNLPVPTPVFRMVHVDCLRTILRRGALHSVNFTPGDGLPDRTIHNVDVQGRRHIRSIPCGLRGTLHDYVPFYFGYLSPMLLQLKTGRVAGYSEGQEPLLYLKTTVQAVKQAEFLIHQTCPWSLIEEIGVLNTVMKTRTEAILNEFDARLGKVVNVRADWYY